MGGRVGGCRRERRCNGRRRQHRTPFLMLAGKARRRRQHGMQRQRSGQPTAARAPDRDALLRAGGVEGLQRWVSQHAQLLRLEHLPPLRQHRQVGPDLRVVGVGGDGVRCVSRRAAAEASREGSAARGRPADRARAHAGASGRDRRLPVCSSGALAAWQAWPGMSSTQLSTAAVMQPAGRQPPSAPAPDSKRPPAPSRRRPAAPGGARAAGQCGAGSSR